MVTKVYPGPHHSSGVVFTLDALTDARGLRLALQCQRDTQPNPASPRSEPLRVQTEQKEFKILEKIKTDPTVVQLKHREQR